MKTIKVLRIIGECKSGGTETIALNYYQNLDHKNIKMDFLFYGKSLPRFANALNKNGDQVFDVTDYTDNLIQSIRDIRIVVKNGNYDIVHAQLNALNVFPLLGAYLGGAKIRIASNHSTASLRYEPKKTIIKYFLRPTSKIFATNFAACSMHAGTWCFGEKNKDRIHIIKNAIDISKFRFSEETRMKIRKEYGWDNKFVIGHVGRFTEQKNHKFIIDIFNEVQKKNKNATLVFVGEGHLEDEIKSKVLSLNLQDKVQFLGVNFKVNELMQGMDVFLFPSLYEGLGNVITEAQAAGLMSVCSEEVPKEVKMTDLVDFISLKSDLKIWSDDILRYSNGYIRRDTSIEIINAGYEITTATKDLERYYISLLKQD